MQPRAYVKKYKDYVIVGLIFLYLFLLGLGVVGELFDIDWILNLPLFKL